MKQHSFSKYIIKAYNNKEVIIKFISTKNYLIQVNNKSLSSFENEQLMNETKPHSNNRKQININMNMQVIKRKNNEKGTKSCHRILKYPKVKGQVSYLT